MAGIFHHEELYRSAESVAQLADCSVVLCGAGALGSNLADTLVRQGFSRIRVVDRDRVEEHNTSTQVYGADDVGAWKTEVLANRLFRSVGVEIDAVRKDLDHRNARKLLRDADIVVDTFDNSQSRGDVQAQCRDSKLPCLHVGLFADYGEVVWDEQYRVPSDVDGDVCDYPLARNLVTLTVSIAAETIVRYALLQQQENWSATLRDFAIRSLAAPVFDSAE